MVVPFGPLTPDTCAGITQLSLETEVALVDRPAVDSRDVGALARLDDEVDVTGVLDAGDCAPVRAVGAPVEGDFDVLGGADTVVLRVAVVDVCVVDVGVADGEPCAE